MTRCRSPRLHPQIGTSEEVSGMPLRRSPRLHPQIHASGNGVGITRRGRRRRGKSPADPESMPLHEDMLREILLRLPPQPSSLLRASAVCNNWRGLVTDPRFLSRFRAHQGKPPLIGVFEARSRGNGINFRSILDPPDRIPPERFDLQRQTGTRTHLLGCRHGRVLLLDEERHMVIVCDPVTGEQHRVAAPPVFRGLYVYGDVLSTATATDQGRSCHSSPFKVVLMSLCGGQDEYEYDDEDDYDGFYATPPIACVYSSRTGVWGNLISTTDRCELDESNPGILVGNVLYWSSKGVSSSIIYMGSDYVTDDIVEFDLDKQSLAVIKGPPSLSGSPCLRRQIIRAEDGAVGLAVFSHGGVEVWHRRLNSHCGTTWFLQNTFEMHTVPGLPPRIEGSMRVETLGHDEDSGAIFLFVDANVYMFQPMSMQFRKLYESRYPIKCHPFASFYTPDLAVPGGCNGVEILHDA